MKKELATYESIRNAHPYLFNNLGAPFSIILDKEDIKNWEEKKQQATQIGVVFNDPFVIILRDLVEFPDGIRNGYIRLYNRAYLEGGAAGVVMLPKMNGKLLLIHQYRHATRSWHWEIPRGFGEAGVNAEDQAKNEIQEEIGGKIKKMINLGLYFNNTGIEGNPIYLFLVEMASIGKPKLKLGADKFIWVTVPEIEKMIANDEINDGFTIAAYTRAQLKKMI
jgi:ADP-ribose pyrophosphatase